MAAAMTLAQLLDPRRFGSTDSSPGIKQGRAYWSTLAAEWQDAAVLACLSEPELDMLAGAISEEDGPAILVLCDALEERGQALELCRLTREGLILLA